MAVSQTEDSCPLPCCLAGRYLLEAAFRYEVTRKGDVAETYLQGSNAPRHHDVGKVPTVDQRPHTSSMSMTNLGLHCRFLDQNENQRLN